MAEYLNKFANVHYNAWGHVIRYYIHYECPSCGSSGTSPKLAHYKGCPHQND